MKIKLTTLCAMILYVMAQAQNSNNLIVFSETGDRFYLVLNGLKYNQSPETNVKVTGLNATNYKAKIIFEKPVGDLNANVYLMWEGNAVNNKEFTYAIKKKGEKYHLKFVSQADIGPQTANSGSVVYNSTAGVPESNTNNTTQSTSVNTSGNGGSYNSTTTVTTSTTTGNAGDGGVSISMSANGMNVNMNGSAPASGSTTVTTTSYTTSTSSSSSGAAVNTNAAATTNTSSSANATAGGCSFAMSDKNFSELTKSIEAKSFEDAKLTVAKQGISANCVSAAQVRKLMDLFSFEDNKLTLTKFAYDYTTDKNNYFKVNDGFSFDSSVDELNNYISNKK